MQQQCETETGTLVSADPLHHLRLQPQTPTLGPKHTPHTHTEAREPISDGTSAEPSWPSTAEARYAAGCPLHAAAM